MPDKRFDQMPCVGDIRMANKYMQRCSIVLVIKEFQVKITAWLNNEDLPYHTGENMNTWNSHMLLMEM